MRSRREFSDEWLDVAGGIAPRSVKGSWMNRAEGMGMAGSVTEAELKQVVDWYSAAQLPTRMKVCPYADESLLKNLCIADFRMTGFEQVFALSLTDARLQTPAVLDPSVEIRRIEHADEAGIRILSLALAAGFATPTSPPCEKDLEHMARCMRRGRASTFAAFAEGVCIGGGGVELDGDLAVLYGAAVAAVWRRKGVQQALMSARLEEAASRGGAIAIISSTPGEGTERNALRFGFAPVYTKVMMERSFVA